MLHSLVVHLTGQHFIEHLQCTSCLGIVLGSRFRIGGTFCNLCLNSVLGAGCAQVTIMGTERPSSRGWGRACVEDSQSKWTKGRGRGRLYRGDGTSNRVVRVGKFLALVCVWDGVGGSAVTGSWRAFCGLWRRMQGRRPGGS